MRNKRVGVGVANTSSIAEDVIKSIMVMKMDEKRFSLKEWEDLNYCEHCFYDGESELSDSDVVDVLNRLNDETVFLAKQKDYWKSKAMTLLMQVRRLTPRMSAKEVIEFSKELEDE